jgi:hypothetical protein
LVEPAANVTIGGGPGFGAAGVRSPPGARDGSTDSADPGDPAGVAGGAVAVG